jgi:serine/threonine-protein kinase
MNNTLRMAILPPSQVGLKPPAAFDAICLRALERNVEARLDSALAFEDSLRAAGMANGLCGSRREVGDWVLAAVGEELAERRNANKVSGNQRVARRIHSPAGGIGAVSESHLTVASAVNELAPSIDSTSAVSSSRSTTRESTPVIESAAISARELGTEGRRRSQWLLAGSGLIVVGGLAWGATRLDRAPTSAPLPVSSALRSTQTSGAPTRPAPAAPPAESKPPAAEGTAAPLAPASAGPSRRRAPLGATRRSASTGLPVAGVAVMPKPESASAPSETHAKKPVWDEDSPLPHP